MPGSSDHNLNPPNTVDYADVVQNVLGRREDEIDQVLELLNDLDLSESDEGCGEFSLALHVMIDFIRTCYPAFTRMDRLRGYRRKPPQENNVNKLPAPASIPTCAEPLPPARHVTSISRPAERSGDTLCFDGDDEEATSYIHE